VKSNVDVYILNL